MFSSFLYFISFLFAFPVQAGQDNSLQPEKQFHGKMIFVSDSQLPLWMEKIFLPSDNNDKASDKIFSSIAAQKNIAAVFHLGDMNGFGSNDGEWEFVDNQLRKLSVNGIPFNPIFGNHDYLIFPGQAKDNFLRRFPFLVPSWYSRRVDSVLVLLLNSNFSRLEPAEQEEQLQWYADQLQRADDDPSISGVIVCIHHSPYTNSRIVDPSEEVRTQFVPAFVSSKKGILFLSGHAHAFEHFKIKKKDFIVVGGGGGLLHPLHMGTSQRWKDISPFTEERRMFHYLYVSSDPGGLTISLFALDDEQSSLKHIPLCTIPWYRSQRTINPVR